VQWSMAGDCVREILGERRPPMVKMRVLRSDMQYATIGYHEMPPSSTLLQACSSPTANY
jgi:hypothetical protein